MADCRSSLAAAGFVPPNESFPRAKEAAQKALELDDTLAQAHTSLAIIKIFYDWDWSGAEREFQRASALNPSDATAHRFYGLALAFTGRLDEGVMEAKRGLELDPLSLTGNFDVGEVFYYARQYDQAIEQLRKTLEMDPSYIPAHYFLGLAYVRKSMYKEATAEHEKTLAASPGNIFILSGLGSAYAVMGRRADAQKVLDRLNDLSKQKYVSASYRARIYANFGKKDRAFEWLEMAYEDHSMFSTKVEPMYDPLRSDPRFTDLLRRMNLQP